MELMIGLVIQILVFCPMCAHWAKFHRRERLPMNQLVRSPVGTTKRSEFLMQGNTMKACISSSSVTGAS